MSSKLQSKASMAKCTEPKITFGIEMEFVLVVPKIQLSELDNGLQKKLKMKLEKKLERIEEYRLDNQLFKAYREKLFDHAAEKLNAQPSSLNGVHNSYLSSSDLDYSQWNLVRDASIRPSLAETSKLNMTKTPTSDMAETGMELVSPIFNFHEKNIWYPQLLQIGNDLKESAYTNESTGLHVHLGLENLELELPTLKSLLLLWAASEQAIESIHPPHRHGQANIWCRSLLHEIKGPDRISKLTLLAFCLLKAETLADIQYFTAQNFSKLNISKATDKKKITVEFREHAGSLAAYEIQAWVSFCRKMLLYSMEVATVVWTKITLLRMFEETERLEKLFEVIGLEQAEKRHFLHKRGRIAAGRT